jgi:competence protein ComEC
MAFKAPAVWLNPGSPGLTWQRLTARAQEIGTVKSAALVSVERGAWWREWSAAARASVRRRIAAIFPATPPYAAAIAAAILIGDRADLDESVQQRLQRAGTFHVIAISGGNVALLAAASFFGLGLFRQSPRITSAVTMLLLLGYGQIVGGDASVTRAVAGASVYLACGIAGLAPRPLDVLAVVALGLVMVDPLAAIDRGAWLSFGATLGILVYAVPAVSGTTGGARVGRAQTAWGRALFGLAASTIAAELILLPVNATLFNRVGIAGLALNFLAIPMMAVVQFAAAAAVVLPGALTPVAHVAALVSTGAAAGLVESTEVVDRFMWLSWRTPAPALWLAAAFYLTGALAFGRASRPLVRRISRTVFAGCALAIAFGTLVVAGRPASGVLRLTMVDVGQGDSLLLQFPSGHTLLVDAGTSTGGFDAGERLVTRALWASGVRTLDWLTFTHADLDHIGGAEAVTRTFGPREIWEGTPVPRDPKRRALADAVRQRGGVWRELTRGDRFVAGDVVVECINPPVADWERQRVRNDDSLVLRARYRDVEFLLTGDIGAEAETRLLSDLGEGPLVRILKVAHHGSRGSSSMPFLREYAPSLAMVSAGRGNLFGHPAPEVLARLQEVGAEVFRTDRDGAIVIETDGSGVAVRTAAGRTWQMGISRLR